MSDPLLASVKVALRISTTAFDGEIENLIDDCLSELSMLGIYNANLSDDPQIEATVKYYCKARFGAAEDAEKWERIYRDKLTKLIIARDYGAALNG